MSKRSPVPEYETAADLAAKLRTVVSRLKRRLREQGGRADLTSSQVSVLLRLEKDGAATVSGLARAEGIRLQSMSSINATLQDAGSGERDRYPDQRTHRRLGRQLIRPALGAWGGRRIRVCWRSCGRSGRGSLYHRAT